MFVVLCLLGAGCLGGSDLAPEIDGPPIGGASHAFLPQPYGVPNAAIPLTAWDAFFDQPATPIPAMRFHEWPAYEPTLGATTNGTLFMSALGSEGISSAEELRAYRAIRSYDGFDWSDVTPRIGPASFPVESGDPYVYVDAATDRVFIMDQQRATCYTLSFSDDHGDTWTVNPAACGLPPGGQDKPTLFAGPPTTTPTTGYPNLLYQCVNRVLASTCAVSSDGGRTFGPTRPVFAGLEPGSAEGNFDTPWCGGLLGHGVAAADGTAYIAKGQCGTPMVAVSVNDGETWANYEISELQMARLEVPAEQPGTGGTTSPYSIVEVAVDEEGHAYVVWVAEDFRLYYAYSEDQGMTWSTPLSLTPPGFGHVAFPAIDAAAPGNLVAAFYATNATDNPLGLTNDAQWHAFLVSVVGANGDEPVALAVQVSADGKPVARGPCGSVNRCAGVGDFIDVIIDAEGRPWMAGIDVCASSCHEGLSGNNANIAFVGTWSAGPSLIRDETLDELDTAVRFDRNQTFQGSINRVVSGGPSATFLIEDEALPFTLKPGSNSATFTLDWNDAASDVRLAVYKRTAATAPVWTSQEMTGGFGEVVWEDENSSIPGLYEVRLSSPDLSVDLRADLTIVVHFEN